MNNQNESEESYYDILEVNKNASQDEIKQKRNSLSIRYHPDKLPPEKREWGTNMIKKINEAYSVLGDPEKRKLYDEYGKDGLDGSAQFANFDIHDLFGGLMGKSKKGHKVQPIKLVINVSLEDIFLGKNIKESIERLTLCDDCDGTGFTDKQKHNCKLCKGNCFIIRTMSLGPGMIQQMRENCFECCGTGKDQKSKNKCNKCKGTGAIKENHFISFDVVPGILNNEFFEIKNQGHSIPNEINKRGSVIVSINELAHKIYKRGGIVIEGRMNPSNLRIEMEITLHEALCGFVKSFKFLDGNTYYIDQYSIIKDGDIKMIKSMGLPHKNKSYKKGDLFIIFKIKYPEDSELTHEQKEKIYEILTKKKFKDSKIHKLPKNIDPVILDTMNQHKEIYEEDYDEDDGVDGVDGVGIGGERVQQCAQQ